MQSKTDNVGVRTFITPHNRIRMDTLRVELVTNFIYAFEHHPFNHPFNHHSLEVVDHVECVGLSIHVSLMAYQILSQLLSMTRYLKVSLS